jgi:sterol desaturase/sphingolipid hydroxylase (fatty acid hydroxylase superfamily)
MAESTWMKIDHSSEPVRLFKSPFLEFFTHISPIAVLIIWVPVVVYFIVRSVLMLPSGSSWLQVPVGVLIGVAVWTFTEYAMHRFVFHFHARSPELQRVFFLFHGVHHYQPQCKTRLVMPPVVSIPLAIVFYAFFYLLVERLFGAPSWVPSLFAGFILGYLVYDMIHYATHHFPMRAGYLKFLKRYHMQHHFKTPDERFGVSSPLWDKIFGTMPA